MIDLQLFSDKSLKYQTPNELRKGIKSIQKRLDEHRAKVENPLDFYPDWNLQSERKKEGDKRHWQHEIKVFEESIQNRIEELKARGEKIE